MKVCAACGAENPDIARFCLACGTQLAEARPPQETRKVVTIVFSDLKGSTSLGEALDSEALREVMTRYFDAMRGELERHGGVIEKFIGDAVMAVFGLPRLHEDDALRAVRAASGMQAALEALNDDLQRVYGVQLANRTGVNTGEVVAGDPSSGQRLVTGDAVNVAARLEQAAGEREVLLGELTYRLVRDEVEVEEVEPLELKGKSEPVPAYRLVGVRDTAATDDRRGAPLVGRGEELAALTSALDEAAASRSCRLVTLAGDAGVGKSRLTAEFLEAASGRALALGGRCLPYGDGITFWPIAEAVKTQAGIVNDDDATEAAAKLAALADPAGDGVTARLASALGLTVEPFPVEELFWAVRRLLAHLAAEREVDPRRGGHPLGRADAARVDRASRPVVRRTGPDPLPDPPRAVRGVACLEHRRAFEPHHPRAARRRRREAHDREPARPRLARHRRARPRRRRRPRATRCSPSSCSACSSTRAPSRR